MRRLIGLSTFLAVGSSCLALCAALLRADVRSDYQTLFGAEEQKVAATRQTTDDTAFAAKLVQSAKSLRDSPKLQILLWQKACEFGLKSSAGYDSALAALDRLIECDQQRQADWQAKRLETLRLAYSRSRGPRRKALGKDYLDALLPAAEAVAEKNKLDEAAVMYRQALLVAKYVGSPATAEIAARGKELSDKAAVLRRLQVRISSLRRQVEKEPESISAREQLILCYLLEADQPAVAATLVTGDLPEALRTYVPLAAKPLGDLAESACLELAAWYVSIAPKGSRTGRINAMLRARGCYDHFLQTHTGRDTTVLKARLDIDKVEKELKRLGADVIPRSEWIDLLKHADPDKHAIGGKWRRNGDVLIGSAAIFNRITIPASVQGDFTLRVLFSRSRGGSDWQAFYVNFPVGPSECALMIDGRKGTVSGLGHVKGKVLQSANSPYKASLLKINQDHTIEVRVKLLSRGTAQIAGRLDGRDVIRWQGPWSVLSSPKKAQWKGVFWVGAFWSNVTLRSVKLYVPRGKPKFVK